MCLDVTEHAENRIDERMFMSVPDILYALFGALDKKEYSQKAPKWYRGNGQYREGTVWVSFKDFDGQPAAAVVDLEEQRLVTVVKK